MGNAISNLWNLLFGRQYNKIIMVGLGAAGKTTILYKLKNPEESLIVLPTTGIYNIETIQYKNNRFTIWDFGSRGNTKSFWRFYFENSQNLIFVIDCNDREHIAEAKRELMGMVQHHPIDLVLLVFANKQDLPNAMSTAELTEELELNKLHRCRWYIQSACATQGHGLYEGLDWLGKELAKKQ